MKHYTLTELQQEAAKVLAEWESHNGSDGAVYAISAKALKVCSLLTQVQPVERRVPLTSDQIEDAHDAANASLKREGSMTAICIWSQDDEGSEFWHTSCRHTFGLTEGTPGENGMEFCCYCGKPLIGEPWAEPEDDWNHPCYERNRCQVQ